MTTPDLAAETRLAEVALIAVFGSDQCGCPCLHAGTGRCDAARGSVPVRLGGAIVVMCSECAACW